MYRNKYIIFVNYQKFLIFGHDILIPLHLNSTVFVIQIEVIVIVIVIEGIVCSAKVSEFMPGKLSFDGLSQSSKIKGLIQCNLVYSKVMRGVAIQKC